MRLKVVGLVALSALWTPAATAVVELEEYAFYHNGLDGDSSYGQVFGNLGEAPAGWDISDIDAGLGAIQGDGYGMVTFSVSAPGKHTVGLIVDHEIDEEINGFSFEYGATQNSPAAGQTWEIDDPHTGGDIYENFLIGALDNANAFPDPGGFPGEGAGDMSMALMHHFELQPDEQAFVTFLLDSTPPFGGFYLDQFDADPRSAGTHIYFSSSLVISGVGIPEPGTIGLLAAGLLGGGVVWRRRCNR